MARALPPPPAQLKPTPHKVMPLSVWLDAGAAWHARVVTPDAQAHDFSSPFALVQFLGQTLRNAPLLGSGGLR